MRFFISACPTSNRDLALLKANAVFSATGMPAISESTVVYVEAGTNKPQSERVYVDADSAPIDALLGRARPISEQEREVSALSHLPSFLAEQMDGALIDPALSSRAREPLPVHCAGYLYHRDRLRFGQRFTAWLRGATNAHGICVI